MDSVSLFLRFKQESDDTAVLRNKDTITFKSIVNSESECFTFDKIFDDSSIQSQLDENVIQPICKKVSLGLDSTIITYGQEFTGKNDTIFDKILPPLVTFQDSNENSLIYISLLDGPTDIPIESIHDLVSYNQSNTNDDKIITIHMEKLDITNDKIISSNINILNISSIPPSKSTITNFTSLSNSILSQNDSFFYLILHCSDSPFNHKETLQTLQFGKSFKESKKLEIPFNTSSLNQNDKTNLFQNDFVVLENFYKDQINMLESAVEQLKSNFKHHTDVDEEKISLSLQISQESNLKAKSQINILTTLLREKDKSVDLDIINAYLNKSITHNTIENIQLSEQNKNDYLTKLESLHSQNDKLLTENNEILSKLLESLEAQQKNLEIEHIDLKMESQEILELNKTFENLLSQSQSQNSNNLANILFPSRTIASNHSHMYSISSTTSTLISDTEIQQPNSKSKHFSIPLNAGFELKVVKPN